jgi:hypothetical protein
LLEDLPFDFDFDFDLLADLLLVLCEALLLGAPFFSNKFTNLTLYSSRHSERSDSSGFLAQGYNPIHAFPAISISFSPLDPSSSRNLRIGSTAFLTSCL